MKKILLILLSLSLVFSVSCDSDYFNDDINKDTGGVEDGFLSKNTNIAGLSVSEGELDSSFDADKSIYTITVAHSIDSITLLVSLEDEKASVSVNEVAIPSDTPSHSIPLEQGLNTVLVLVVAEDSNFNKVYTINITRQCPPSGNNSLTSLQVSSGSLSPAFQGNVTDYTVSVGNNVTAISFTAAAEDASASLEINDVAVQSGVAFGPSPLAVGDNHFKLVVTAPDGSPGEYTITVNRFDPVYHGTYTISDIDDIENLAGIEEIDGFLVINDFSPVRDGQVVQEDLKGLESIRRISGALIVSYNSSLSNLNGLNDLRTIGGDLIVENNQGLKSLDGLGRLESIGGHIHIYENRGFIRISSLSAIRYVGGSIILDDNNDMVDVNSGLVYLNAIGGSIQIIGNDSLVGVGHLSNIDSVTNLVIRNNNSLEVINLWGLQSVTGNMNVDYNNRLARFDFRSLHTVAGQFFFFCNPGLPRSSVEALHDQLNEAPAEVAIVVTCY